MVIIISFIASFLTTANIGYIFFKHNQSFIKQKQFGMVKSRLDIERLKSIIYEKKITQAALAKMLGVTPATVSSYFVGRSNPPMEVIEKIASVLGVSADTLLAGDGLRDEQIKLIDACMVSFAYELQKGIVSLDIPAESKIAVLEYIQATFDHTRENYLGRKTGCVTISDLHNFIVN